MKPYDLFALMAAYARDKGIALNSPDLVESFLADARDRLATAQGDEKLIHGARTERQFEAMVVTLGRFKMLKVEDLGRLHTKATCRTPDYRVVLEDGRQWLVEVKNVRCADPMRQATKLTAPYLASLAAYADIVGVPLRIAIYWSTWKLWTLIDPERFRSPGGTARIEMGAALQASELAELGDLWLFTEAPLRLVVTADQDKPVEIMDDGRASFFPAGMRMYCGDRELTDTPSRQLAQILMLYGEWATEGPSILQHQGKIVGAEFRAEPHEPDAPDAPPLMGYLIGQASRIFARYFAAETMEGDAVIRLDGRPAPEWFAPLAAWDFRKSQLPLWVLHMKASAPGKSKNARQ